MRTIIANTGNSVPINPATVRLMNRSHGQDGHPAGELRGTDAGVGGDGFAVV